MREGGTLLTLALVLGVLPGCGEPQPAIRVTSDTVLVDEAVRIAVNGLPPRARVIVHSTLESPGGGRWSSRAAFVADSAGTVDLTVAESVDGSYVGVDPMGLFWSATRSEGKPVPQRVGDGLERVLLAAEVDGTIVAEATLWRRRYHPELGVTPVHDGELVGTFHTPPGAGPHPGLLVLGGSECGIASAENTAAALATHGYAALALAYCVWPDSAGAVPQGMESLPRGLVEVPLDSVERALVWLRRQPAVDSTRVGVWGGSKGAELALLLAARNADIRAVVATKPSHVVWQAIGGGPEPRSSWSLDGEPLPFVPYTRDSTRIARYADGAPAQIAHVYRASLEDSAAVRRAVIPVERIKGAVLLVSGRDDMLWPSTYMADRVMQRLERFDHPFPYRHLAYDGAGHAIGRPYEPTTESANGGMFPMGGTPEGYARAEADWWPKALRFLEENLRSVGR